MFGLSPREWQVVELLVRTGWRNAQLGIALGIAEKTVKVHLEHAYLKLGVRSRGELIATYWRLMHGSREGRSP